MKSVKKQRVSDDIPYSALLILCRGLQDELLPGYAGGIDIQDKYDGTTLVEFTAHRSECHWYTYVKELPNQTSYDECMAMGREAAVQLNLYITASGG